jgi:hypothetical protein
VHAADPVVDGAHAGGKVVLGEAAHNLRAERVVAEEEVADAGDENFQD